VGLRAIADVERGVGARQVPPGTWPALRVALDLDRLEHESPALAMDRHLVGRQAEFLRQANGLTSSRPENLGASTPT